MPAQAPLLLQVNADLRSALRTFHVPELLELVCTVYLLASLSFVRKVCSPMVTECHA